MKVKTAHTYKPLQDLGRSFFKIFKFKSSAKIFFIAGKSLTAPRILLCNITSNLILWAVWTSHYAYNSKNPKKVIFNLKPRGENGKLGLDLTSLVLSLELMANGASWAGLSIACSDSETLPVGWHCPEQQHPQNPSSSGLPKNQFQESLWSLTFF